MELMGVFFRMQNKYRQSVGAESSLLTLWGGTSLLASIRCLLPAVSANPAKMVVCCVIPIVIPFYLTVPRLEGVRL